MPRREPTDASKRDARTLFIRPFNAIESSQGGLTISTVYYNAVMEMMPLGFRGSFLKFIGFPASWATAYGLSPAQVSQNRYSADVLRIWREVESGDISAEKKLATTTLIIRSYIIAAPSVMDMSVFPEFRRPRWMTAQQKEFLVLAVSGAYAQRAELEAFGTLVEREEESAMSREEQLQAGAEPTAAEQMRVEMGGEGAPEEEQAGTSEADVQLQREIREHITLPRSIDSPMDDAVYMAIYTLIKLGYERSDVDFALRSLIANYNLVPIVVEPPQSTQERQSYSMSDVPFLRINLTQASMDARAFDSQRALYYARTISGNPEATDMLSSEFSLQQFSNTQRERRAPLQGVLRVPLPAASSRLTVNQLAAEILRLREQSLATASRMAGVEPTAAETTTTTQEVPTSIQIIDLSDELRNRMRRGGPNYKIVAFQMAGSQALYGESHRLRTEVPMVSGSARNDMNYIFYLAKPNVGMEGYRAVQFWQLSFGQIPYDIAEGGKVTNMTFVRNIMNYRRQQPGAVRLDEPHVEAKRSLRKFLSEPSTFVVFRPQWLGTNDNLLHRDIDTAEITATSETLQNMMSQLFTMVRERNRREATRREQQTSSSDSSQLTITANPMDEAMEQNDELTSGSSATEQDAAARPVTSFAAARNKKIDRTFAYEIEGDITMAADRDRTSLYEALREGVRNAGAELNVPTDRLKLYTSTDDTFKKFNEYSIKGDPSVVGARPFETDSRLFVPPRVDVGTTTANDMLTPKQFEKLKYSKVEDMWRDINTMSTAMLKAGVRIHKSAGLHIHMSTSDFSDEEMRNYIKNYIKLEPLLDLMMPVNSREGGRSWNGSISIAAQIRTGWQKGQRTPIPLPARWINYPRQNERNKIRTETDISTIEFRHPMTNIEGDLIKHFVLLHYHLCEAAKVGVLPDGKFKTLETILPVETSTFLFNRIEDLDQPKLKTKAEENRFFTGSRGQDTALEKNNLT